MADEKLLVTAAEAAQMLSIGKSTLWREVKCKRLPAPIKFGGIVRWRVEDLHRAIANLTSPHTTA